MTLAEKLAHITAAEQSAVSALNALGLPYTEQAFESDAVLTIERTFKAAYGMAWPNCGTQADVRWNGCIRRADWR